MPITRHPLMPTPLTEYKPAIIPIDLATVSRLTVSFEHIRSHSDELGMAFFRRLFEEAPTIRGLFPADTAVQQRALLETLSMVVDHLNKPAEILPALRLLGKRHAGYGTTTAHYALACMVLVKSIGEITTKVNAPWSLLLASEWMTALDLVAEIMANGPEIKGEPTKIAERTP